MPMNGADFHKLTLQNSRAEFMEVRMEPCSNWPEEVLGKIPQKSSLCVGPCDSDTLRQQVLEGREAIHSWAPGRG